MECWESLSWHHKCTLAMRGLWPSCNLKQFNDSHKVYLPCKLEAWPMQAMRYWSSRTLSMMDVAWSRVVNMSLAVRASSLTSLSQATQYSHHLNESGRTRMGTSLEWVYSVASAAKRQVHLFSVLVRSHEKIAQHWYSFHMRQHLTSILVCPLYISLIYNKNCECHSSTPDTCIPVYWNICIICWPSCTLACRWFQQRLDWTLRR